MMIRLALSISGALLLGLLIYRISNDPPGSPPATKSRTIPESKRWLLEKYEDQLPPYPDSWYEED